MEVSRSDCFGSRYDGGGYSFSFSFSFSSVRWEGAPGQARPCLVGGRAGGRAGHEAKPRQTQQRPAATSGHAPPLPFPSLPGTTKGGQSTAATARSRWPRQEPRRRRWRRSWLVLVDAAEEQTTREPRDRRPQRSVSNPEQAPAARPPARLPGLPTSPGQDFRHPLFRGEGRLGLRSQLALLLAASLLRRRGRAPQPESSTETQRPNNNSSNCISNQWQRDDHHRHQQYNGGKDGSKNKNISDQNTCKYRGLRRQKSVEASLSAKRNNSNNNINNYNGSSSNSSNKPWYRLRAFGKAKAQCKP